MISVIIPIYKTERYLSRCLDSVLAQSYSDLEVLLIDDGSPDHCPELCEEYAAKDKRIRVIHQKNQGQAVARNHALDVAQGEYIGFVDSDDYIHPKMYETLLDNALNFNANVSVGRVKNVTDSLFLFEETVNDPVVYKGKEFLKECLMNGGGIKGWILCDKLFHRSCFENIRMPAGRIYEDNAVVYKILYEAEKVVDCDAPLYYYYQNSESTVNQSFKLKHLDWLTVLEEMLVFFEEKEERELFDKINKTYLFSLAELHKKTKELLNEPEAEMVLLEKLRRQYRIEKRKYPISMKTHPWLYDELYPLYAKIYWKLHR